MATRISYQTIIDIWPLNAPLLCLGGTGWDPLIATVFEEVSWSALATEPFLLKGTRGDLSATVGLVSYDQWAGEASQPAPSRFFRIHEAIKVDPSTGLFRLMGSREGLPRHFALDFKVARHLVDALNTGFADSSSAGPGPDLMPEEEVSITPFDNAETYLSTVSKVLEDIRAGRYYQLNLLRYFRCPRPPTRSTLAARLDLRGGPMSAWLGLDGLDVISFSPERFVDAYQEDKDEDSVRLETAPIKGTVARSGDPEQDRTLKASLAQSAKDRAELAMIVDLMRNDLARVSVPRSISVQDPGSIQSFSHVHHLVARVSSRAKSSLPLGSLLSVLCPGGSITGAPKQDVMAAIRRYEGRARRYFMGHIFYWDGCGGMRSSILIRTAIAEGGWDKLQYAAGSGIVIRSDPGEELKEIRTKTRVLADDVADF